MTDFTGEPQKKTFGPLHMYGIHEPVALPTSGDGGSNEGRDRGDYISTYTDRFYPMSPRASEVRIIDIAHSLSMQCRYAGHCRLFYSVAEHSVLVAQHVSPRNRLAALLHDAPEAYLVDVPRPVKRAINGYKAAEDRVWIAIAAAFCLSPYLPDEVHDIDSRIIADEMRQNMHECDLNHVEPLGVRLRFWSPERAEHEFLALYRELIEERKVKDAFNDNRADHRPEARAAAGGKVF